MIGVNGASEAAAEYDPLTGRGIAAGTMNGAYDLSVSASTVVLPPWQNPALRQDVDNDGVVAPLDALRIINRLNADEGGPLPAPGEDAPPPYLDVDGDGFLAPLDALQVINYLNAAAAIQEVFAAPISMEVNSRLDDTGSSESPVAVEPVTIVGQSDSPMPVAVELLFQDVDRSTRSAAQLDRSVTSINDLLDVDELDLL